MFRLVPVTRADYPLLARWLRTPAVARWWSDSPEPQALEAEYGGVIDGVEPAEVFIVHDDARPFALVQRFALAAYPEYEAEVARWTEVPPGAFSIDYFIGEPDALRQGFGTALIAQLTASIWRDAPAAPAILVPVHADNRASWRVLERNGYRRAAEAEMAPDNPVDSHAHLIYRADRDSASSASRNTRTLAGTSLRPGSKA